jgi:hypothetical protein
VSGSTPLPGLAFGFRTTLRTTGFGFGFGLAVVVFGTVFLVVGAGVDVDVVVGVGVGLLTELLTEAATVGVCTA